MYYRNTLKILRRLDLENPNIETICLQVKAGPTDLLIGIAYCSPNNNNFFTEFPKALERMWMKHANIVLLGDVNCNLLQNRHDGSTLQEGIKMKNILEQFNMCNIIQTPTRIVPTTPEHGKTLSILGARVPWAYQTMHDLIYATLSVKTSREPPMIINTRNFKRFNENKFRQDIAWAPFSVCSIFDDPSDTYHARNLLFAEICDEHAPFKQVKVRSSTLPWVTKEIN